MSLVFNLGKRTFLDIKKDSEGKPLNLDPGTNMEFSEKKAKSLVKSYPKELSLVEGDSQRQKKRANEIKQKEAELDKREAALNIREENLKKSENGDEKEPKEKNGDKK